MITITMTITQSRPHFLGQWFNNLQRAGRDKTWGRPWPRPWGRPWPKLINKKQEEKNRCDINPPSPKGQTFQRRFIGKWFFIEMYLSQSWAICSKSR